MSGESPMKLVAADHPQQQAVAGLAALPLFLRIDATHELPVVVYDGAGRETARFRNPADAAAFAKVRTMIDFRALTLPQPIVATWTKSQQSVRIETDLPRRERSERQPAAGAVTSAGSRSLSHEETIS